MFFALISADFPLFIQLVNWVLQLLFHFPPDLLLLRVYLEHLFKVNTSYSLCQCCECHYANFVKLPVYVTLHTLSSIHSDLL